VFFLVKWFFKNSSLFFEEIFEQYYWQTVEKGRVFHIQCRLLPPLYQTMRFGTVAGVRGKIRNRLLDLIAANESRRTRTLPAQSVLAPPNAASLRAQKGGTLVPPFNEALRPAVSLSVPRIKRLTSDEGTLFGIITFVNYITANAWSSMKVTGLSSRGDE
jgi:hypothetical protein